MKTMNVSSTRCDAAWCREPACLWFSRCPFGVWRSGYRKVVSGIGAARLPQMLTHRRLALGTAQFGMDYGVANTGGRVTRAALADILTTAARAGLDTLDTAIAYGQSEACLGAAGVDNWRVITKLPRLPDPAPPDVRAWVLAAVQGSLDRLQLPGLTAVLLHHPADLLGRHGPDLAWALAELKDLPEDLRQRILEVQEKSGFVPNVFLALARRPR